MRLLIAFIKRMVASLCWANHRRGICRNHNGSMALQGCSFFTRFSSGFLQRALHDFEGLYREDGGISMLGKLSLGDIVQKSAGANLKRKTCEDEDNSKRHFLVGRLLSLSSVFHTCFTREGFPNISFKCLFNSPESFPCHFPLI